MGSISPEQMQNFSNFQASGQQPTEANFSNMMNNVVQENLPNVMNNVIEENLQNSMNDNTNSNNDIVDETDDSQSINMDELREKYSDQIEQIKNMGFSDENEIINVLNQSSGSVSIALNKLLS